MFEKTALEFQLQHTENSLVQKFLIHKSFLHSLAESGEGFVPESHVHAGFEGGGSRMKSISLGIFKEVHSQTVCHDNALKTHLFPEYIS